MALVRLYYTVLCTRDRVRFQSARCVDTGPTRRTNKRSVLRIKKNNNKKRGSMMDEKRLKNNVTLYEYLIGPNWSRVMISSRCISPCPDLSVYKNPYGFVFYAERSCWIIHQRSIPCGHNSLCFFLFHFLFWVFLIVFHVPTVYTKESLEEDEEKSFLYPPFCLRPVTMHLSFGRQKG